MSLEQKKKAMFPKQLISPIISELGPVVDYSLELRELAEGSLYTGEELDSAFVQTLREKLQTSQTAVEQAIEKISDRLDRDDEEEKELRDKIDTPIDDALIEVKHLLHVIRGDKVIFDQEFERLFLQSLEDIESRIMEANGILYDSIKRIPGPPRRKRRTPKG